MQTHPLSPAPPPTMWTTPLPAKSMTPLVLVKKGSGAPVAQSMRLADSQPARARLPAALSFTPRGGMKANDWRCWSTASLAFLAARHCWVVLSGQRARIAIAYSISLDKNIPMKETVSRATENLPESDHIQCTTRGYIQAAITQV